MTATYKAFLETKRLVAPSSGHEVAPHALHPGLKPFQAAVVQWALRRGCAGIFADRGLGKTWMAVSWAMHVPGRVLIVAPLAVAQQTVRLARDAMGVQVDYVRTPEEMRSHISITNYDRIHHFVSVEAAGICLDESAAIRGLSAKRRALLLAHFGHIPYRIVCSAMPAPNSVEEIGSQAQFLGVMTLNAMRSTFFVHDETGWRLRGHARPAFYRWLASWAVALRTPADLGFDGSEFVLPPHTILEHWLTWDSRRLLADGDGQLGIAGTQALHGICDRVAVRQQTTEIRCAYAAHLAQQAQGQVVAWCGLSGESSQLAALLGADAYEVKGSQDPDVKERLLLGFVDGERKVLITKASIAGHGLNMQNATTAIFVGLSDSQELFYQAVGRLHRFGQRQPVTTHTVLSDHEEPIWRNVQRKEREALTMIDGLIAEVRRMQGGHVRGEERDMVDAYGTSCTHSMVVPRWLL